MEVAKIVFPAFVSICMAFCTIAMENMMFETFDANTCGSSNEDIVQTDMSYSDCLKQCDTRPDCTAVNYKQKAVLCILNFKEVTPRECQGYVYSRKTYWEQTRSVPCNCPKGNRCGQNQACFPSVCERLLDPEHGLIFGRRLSVGDKVSFRCYPGYVLNVTRSRVCQTDGAWSGQHGNCIEDPKCNNYLVSGQTGVKNYQLTESSHWCKVYGCFYFNPGATSAWFARLNSTGHLTGSWIAPPGDSTEDFVQVDFLHAKIIAGIALQGRDTTIWNWNHYPYQYVTSFKVLVSLNCTVFNVVSDETGADKIFEGNSDPEEIVVRSLPERAIARCVRINPLQWVGHNSLRFDVLGC